MLYDRHGIDPNPVRDRRVKLPHERKRDLIVPLAGHVEAVAAVLPRMHLLPYLVIDWTGLRLWALEEAKVRDLDERRQAFLAPYALADYTEVDYGALLKTWIPAVGSSASCSGLTRTRREVGNTGRRARRAAGARE